MVLSKTRLSFFFFWQKSLPLLTLLLAHSWALREMDSLTDTRKPWALRCLSGAEHLGLPWWSRGLRIHLPVQGTQVRSLVCEHPTCCNYWSLCAPRQDKPPQRGACRLQWRVAPAPQLEKAGAQQRRLSTAKSKQTCK